MSSCTSPRDPDRTARVAAEFRERVGKLDVLVNNAGAMYARRRETGEGLEMTWALNHLTPFLLTRELLPLLRESRDGREVTVSSEAHRFGRMHGDDPEFRHRYGGRASWRTFSSRGSWRGARPA